MAYGVVIAYNTMAPFLLQKTLGYSPSFYGWLTLCVAISYYLGTSVNRKWVAKYRPRLMINLGLALILASAFAMLSGFWLVGISSLLWIFIPVLIATFGQALIWSNCIAGALKNLAHMAGTAAALFSSLQMLLSALVSGLLTLPTETSQLPLGLAFLVLVVLAKISFSLVFARTNASN
jgi:DHA1 family 2-module integral membrane pump EmrD-like MFS transporter